MRKILVLGSLALFGLVTSCDDATEPPLDVPPANRIIQDAVHNFGNPFFFWLSPMVPQPNSADFGIADPHAAPSIRLSCLESAGGGCDDGPILLETLTSADGISYADEHYQLDFDTKLTYGGHTLLTSDPPTESTRTYTTYRLEVVLTDGTTDVVVGTADFELGATGGDARNLATGDIIGLKDGRTLPLRFRVEENAYEYGALALEQDPCPQGCETTSLEPNSTEEQTAYYTDPTTGDRLTGLRFPAGALPELEEGEQYTLLIGPVEIGTEGDICAPALEDPSKTDCYRYTLIPDNPFDPSRVGICTVEAGDLRMAKADDNLITFPDPVNVDDLGLCEPAEPLTVGMVERLLRGTVDWLVAPLFAQTSTRVFGGMINDLSDIFLILKQGLVSHWTADQIGYIEDGEIVENPAADALGLNHGQWIGGTPNYQPGISGDAFAFVGDTRILRTSPATDWGTSQNLTVAGWIYMDPMGAADQLQRLVTGTGSDGERVYFFQDDAQANEGRVLRLVMNFLTPGGESPTTAYQIRVPNALSEGCWQHVAATYDGNMRLYVNATEMHAITGIDLELVTATNLWLSHDFSDEAGVPTASLHGRIDELRAYDRALSAEEMTALFELRPAEADVCPAPTAVSVEVTPESQEVPEGFSVPLTAGAFEDGAPLGEQSFNWTSSNPNVAVVDASGNVTGVAPGQAQIHATTVVNGGAYTGSASVTVYAPIGAWSSAGSLATPRRDHIAIYLEDGPEAGKVLIAGGTASGAELYDPVTGTSTQLAGAAQRGQHPTATRLLDGTILLAGGVGGGAEIFNPVDLTFTPTQDPMEQSRFAHTATLLSDGGVLLVGGNSVNGILSTAEIYNPSTGQFSATGSMSINRDLHGAARLSDGRVLVAGGTHQGASGAASVASAEIYDPASGTFSPVGSMSTAGAPHWFRAHTLPDGAVIMVPTSGVAEVFDPSTETFDQPATFWSPRRAGAGVSLADGRVFFTGGWFDDPDDGPTARAAAELFDSSTRSFLVADEMIAPRIQHRMVQLPGGDVLVFGGYSPATEADMASVERFQLVPPEG